VDAQRGAYITSVLVLIASASAAVVLDRRRESAEAGRRRLSWPAMCLCAGFHLAMAVVLVTQPAGLLIALCFIVAILATGIVSRAIRSTEPRFAGFTFKDAQSKFLWQSLVYLEFPILLPHRPGGHSLPEKEQTIRQRHRLPADMPVVFLEAVLGDASAFYQ